MKPKGGAKFLLAHNYSAYPLVRQARGMIARGDLGNIRVVQVEYAQDWLTEPTADNNKQAAWRTDPAKSGAGGCIGDIGTHAFQLAGFVTCLRADAVSADLTSFVPGRPVDDNVHMMLRFENGARGMLWASQVAVGCENGLRLRVYGDRVSLEWIQENPNEIWFTEFGKPRQRLTRNGAPPPAGPVDGIGARIPGGHPEGYLEAFATLYRDFAEVIRGAATDASHLPTLTGGFTGMRFIAAAIHSSSENCAWTTLEH